MTSDSFQYNSVLASLIINPEDFKTIKYLGKGSFSSVTLVKKEGSSQLYALKSITAPSNSTISKIEKDFIRELSILITFDFPSITRLYGFYIPQDIESEKYQFLLEYCPNGDIKSRLDPSCPRPLTSTKRMICAYGIAKTMDKIHASHIVHRDLKPENVFLDANDYPKISDFGLSKIIGNHWDGKMTQNLGSPYYMAPELFDQSETPSFSQYNNKVDVYAYSLILLSFFVDSFTFENGNPQNLTELYRHINSGRRYVIPETVPSSYKKLIRQCWSGDPDQRPSFNKIAEELSNFEKYKIGNADLNEVRAYKESLDGYCSRFGKQPLNEADEEVEETQPFAF